MADLTEEGGLLGKLAERIDERDDLPKREEKPAFDEDLLVKDEDLGTTHHDDGLRDQIKSELSIIDAYNRWAGKGAAHVPTGRTESIMVRCPNPAHPDSNPSAWLNTEKDTYYCGACAEGGDAFDIAAFSLGFPVPAYRGDERFAKVKNYVAEQLGYRMVTTPGGSRYLEKPEAPPEAKSEPTPEPVAEPQPADEREASAIARFRKEFTPSTPVLPEPDSGDAKVISLVPRPDDEDAEPVTPSIDWRDLLPSDTFMRKWMEATSNDDLPEEYYFWLGMLSVGLAVNNHMALADNPPVKPNLFLVLYGHTGIGKSRATNATLSLLREALPWDGGNGVFQVPSPGSAESLIDAFAFGGTEDMEKKEEEASPKEGESETKTGIPVTGLIRFDELSTLMGRASRTGSAMKPTLMEFYDSYNPVTHKTRGHGLVEAHGHFASCVTTTQPKAIRELLTQTDADAGFVNRWIFATGVDKRPIAFGRKDIDYDRCVPLLQAIAEWAAFTKLGRTKTSTSGFAWGAVSLTPEALALWEEFFYDVLVPTKNDDKTALLSRIDLTMKKVISLIAFDRQHMPVEVEDVRDALKVWEYLKQSYGMLGREIGVGVFEDCRHAVNDIVKAHYHRTEKHATARDILRGIGSRFSSSLVKSVLETLVSLGELKEYIEVAESGQRKAPRYAYVD